ncbi:MAG: hydantoin utilization protein B, partial [Mesorhizobium sp.]
AQDVRRGYVSEASAERDYGVVIRDGEVDEQATGQLRARHKPSAGHFHFGPERDGYEAQWTPAAYDRLTAILRDLPIHWRFFAKTEIFRRMRGRSGPEGVQAAFDAACERFPELPRPRPVREAAE